MRFQIIVSLLLLFFGLFCGESPEKLVKQGQKALVDENNAIATEYFMRALEATYDSDMFWDGSYKRYTDIMVALSGSHILLAQNYERKDQGAFIVARNDGSKQWRKKLHGVLRQLYISPQGKYAVFNIEDQEGICRLSLWNIEEHTESNVGPKISCQDAPAVTDSGEAWFVLDNKVSVFRNGKIEQLGAPSAPESGITAWVTFAVSLDNRIYLNYGSAGRYKLYSVQDGKLMELTRESASRRIFFAEDKKSPGVISGGADQRTLVFYQPGSNSQRRNYPARAWKDAAVISAEKYYFLEDERVHLVQSEKVIPLSIWGQRIFPLPSGNLLVLTPYGRVLEYSGQKLSDQSREVFELTWESK